jgi:hypothetical protein
MIFDPAQRAAWQGDDGLGASPAPSVLAAPLMQRIYPYPSQGTVQLYNATTIAPGAKGIVTAMPRDAPGWRVQLPAGTRYLELDPQSTTPGTIVAVCLPGMSEHSTVLLRPGGSIASRQAFESITVWNGLGYLFDQLYGVRGTMGDLFAPAQACAFLTASDVDALIVRGHGEPAPRPGFSSVITTSLAAGAVPSVLGGATSIPMLPTAGLRGMRIAVVCLDAGSNVITPPADLAASLRIYYLLPLPRLVAGGFGLFAGAADSPDFKIVSDARAWAPASDLDCLVSQTQTVFDRAIVAASSAVAIGLPGALTGTGVTALGVSIEVT